MLRLFEASKNVREYVSEYETNSGTVVPAAQGQSNNIAMHILHVMTSLELS
jgi:hypothetical protein